MNTQVQTQEAQLLALLEVVKRAGKETTLSAFVVSEYLISWGVAKKAMTRTKIQKLLYYIQGYHLLTYGKPMFKEDFQAHATGFIIPSLYKEHTEKYGWRVIAKSPFTYRGTDFTEATVIFIHKVLDEFGELDGKTLEELVHQESIWLETVEGEFITKEDLLHQFEQEHQG